MSTSQTRLDPQHYLRAIEDNSTRFVDVLADVAPETRVPTCPDWTAGDLLHHLGQVQHFWALVVSTNTRTDAEAEELVPLPRPEAWDDLARAVEGARGRLLESLGDADPEAAVWTWAPHDQSVGFVLRRQAHEACIHRLDAELTAGADGSARTAVDPLLAADGVDEVLRLVAAMPESDAEVEVEEGRVVRIVATDTDTTWLATMTRVVERRDGRPHAAQGITVAAADPTDGTVRPAAILSGTAEDLDCLLWARPVLGEIHRNGDLTLLAEFESAVATAFRH